MSDDSVSFRTTLSGADDMNATGVVVPPEVIEQLGAGKKPPVHVSLNGYEYRTTVAVMGGQYMFGVSAAIRKETGLAAGDPIDVVLRVATTPREVDVPDDFAAALATEPAAKSFYDGLSNSVRRYHVDNINGAKTDETRARRIDKAIALFLAGKQR